MESPQPATQECVTKENIPTDPPGILPFYINGDKTSPASAVTSPQRVCVQHCIFRFFKAKTEEKANNNCLRLGLNRRLLNFKTNLSSFLRFLRDRELSKGNLKLKLHQEKLL